MCHFKNGEVLQLHTTITRKVFFFLNTYNERKMTIIIIIEISTSSALVCGPCGHSNEEVQGGGLITADCVLGLRLARL